MQWLAHQPIRLLEILYLFIIQKIKWFCYNLKNIIFNTKRQYIVPFRYLRRTWGCVADWELRTESTPIRAFDCNTAIYKVLSAIVCMAIVKLPVFVGLEAGFNTFMFAFQSYLIRLDFRVFWITDICLQTSKLFCNYIRTAERLLKLRRICFYVYALLTLQPWFLSYIMLVSPFSNM